MELQNQVINKVLTILSVVFFLAGASTFAGTEYQAKKEAAFQACGQSPSVDWKTLSQEQRETLHSCLVEQGFQPHHYPKFFKAMQACATEKGVELPKFQPGNPPELTDAQKAVLKECKEEVAANFKANRSAASTQSTN